MGGKLKALAEAKSSFEHVEGKFRILSIDLLDRKPNLIHKKTSNLHETKIFKIRIHTIPT